MNRGLIGAAIAGLIVLAIILGSWYTVDQTERGVLLRTGAVDRHRAARPRLQGAR